MFNMINADYRISFRQATVCYRAAAAAALASSVAGFSLSRTASHAPVAIPQYTNMVLLFSTATVVMTATVGTIYLAKSIFQYISSTS